MAARFVSITGWGLTGAYLFCVLAPVAVILWYGNDLGAWRGGDQEALVFTLWQSALSAVISCALGAVFAASLHRREFYGRKLLISLISVPFLLSIIVALLGLLMIFGPRGLFASALAPWGLNPDLFYGPWGVILAHVFFNLPLATRVVLFALEAIPAEEFRLAQAYGFSHFTRHRHVIAAVLRRTLPPLAAAIFLICLGSFTVPLVVGGGPKATTLELGIYQAFRFDFDFGRAARLGVLQWLIAMGVGIALWFWPAKSWNAAPARRRSKVKFQGLLIWDVIVITALSLFLILPLIAPIMRGLAAIADLPPSLWFAALRSLCVALASAVLAHAWSLHLMRWSWGGPVAILSLAISPMIFGFGSFILLVNCCTPRDLGLGVTALSNALVATPFVVSVLRPAYVDIVHKNTRLGAAYALAPRVWWGRIVLPQLAGPIGFTTGMTMALSMGDLGVVLLFSNPATPTLPQAIHALMGQYRMDEAYGAACVLTLISAAVFVSAQKLGGRFARL